MNKIQVRTVNNNIILFQAVATWILSGKSILLHWTDNNGTIHDILFSLPLPVGHPKQGLCISVVGYRSFIIPTIGEDLHESYYSEKLSYPKNTTLAQLTELFNGVRKYLTNQINL